MRAFLMLTAALLLGAAHSGEAMATVTSCTVVQPTLAPTYASTANSDVSGTFTVTCSRTGNGKETANLLVALSPGGTQTIGNTYPDTLNYALYKDAPGGIPWTSGTYSATAASGVAVAVLYSGNSPSSSVSWPAYLRIPSDQLGKAAGGYSGTQTINVYDITSTTINPPLVGTSTLNVSASIAKNCTFGSPPPSWSLSYVALSPNDLVDTSQNLPVTCTKGTGYTLALDATGGVIPGVALAYTLTFTATASGTVQGTSASGTAAASHYLTLTLPARQAGSCVAASCTGSDTRTVTVTY